MSKKSILDTINSGFDTPLIIKNPEPSITFNTGFGDSNTITVQKEEKLCEKPSIEMPVYKETINFESSFDTGFIEQILTPLLPHIEFLQHIIKNQNSITDSVDTGFGCSDTVILDCPKPKYKSHLCRENYLGEFNTESEKQQARTNLGVYSIKEIDKIISNIEINNISIKDVEKIIAQSDFVRSEYKTFVNYQIPNDLFK